MSSSLTNSTASTPLRWTRHTRIGVGVWLTIHSLLLGWLAVMYSPTRDEPAHLAAGYRLWTTGRADLYTVNPPLVKALATWPLLFFDPVTDWSRVSDAPGARPEFLTGRVFLENNPRTWEWMLILARWACIPLSLIGAVVAFHWAREVFGATSGWISLVLWTFDPNILGNGCLITPDVGGSSLGLLAGYLFWKWLNSPTWERATLAGLGLGLALLSKATLLILGPLWIVLWVIHPWCRGEGDWFHIAIRPSGRELSQLALLLLLSVYLLNLGYGFSGTGAKLKDFEFVSRTLAGEMRPGQISANRFRNDLIGELPVPVPREFLRGLDLQKKDFEMGRWSFLAGHWKQGGWPYFYLEAIALKSPLGYGVLLLLALGAIWRGGLAIRPPAVVIGLPMLALIGFVSREQGFTIFVRYVLPALPFAVVLLAGAGRWVETGARWAPYVIGITMAWIVSSSLYGFPYSLSYFNELAGGPAQGHRYLLDSNVDWGQDLYFVKKWVENHPEARPVTLSWDDLFDPERVGLNLPTTPAGLDAASRNTSTPAVRSFAGWHIVCVNNLHNMDGRLRYLREIEPVDRIGYSVMVYHLSEEQSQSIQGKASSSPLPLPAQ